LIGDGKMAIRAKEARGCVRRKPAGPLLLLGGVPLGEPVARYGLFVMNTEQELKKAFQDLRSGKMGRSPDGAGPIARPSGRWPPGSDERSFFSDERGPRYEGGKPCFPDPVKLAQRQLARDRANTSRFPVSSSARSLACRFLRSPICGDSVALRLRRVPVLGKGPRAKVAVRRCALELRRVPDQGTRAQPRKQTNVLPSFDVNDFDETMIGPGVTTSCAS
jgi:hypothetical protein